MATSSERLSLFLKREFRPAILAFSAGILTLVGVTVLFQVLFPETISTQKKIRYENWEKQDVELASILNRLACKPDTIRRYAAEIKSLALNPDLFRNWSSENLFALDQGIQGARVFGYKLSAAERLDLCRDETKLMGLVSMALHADLDPTFDPKLKMSLRYSPYDPLVRDEDLKDPAKKKAYDAKRAIWEKEFQKAKSEWKKRRHLRYVLLRSQSYLRQIFAKEEGESIEADVKPSLVEAGVNEVTIDFLLGKTPLPAGD